jgi:catechol 2,3-dioxygenase-like lactoylglutathione lyase family enzyme
MKGKPMQLGAFSISLVVKDLAKSIAFYETLGFSRFGGTDEHGYAVLKNGETLVGLYHGMFDRNMLTFNPVWDQSASAVDPFDDVRDIKAKLKARVMRSAKKQGTPQDPDHSL